jgi:hypothetical protein
MDFKKATDELMAGMSRAEIADVLNCSEATVRQARLDKDANAHRNPPPGWEAALARLARKRAELLQRLADKLG